MNASMLILRRTLFLSALTLLSSSVFALTVVNPSFEAGTPGSGGNAEGTYTSGSFTGWTADANSGFWQPVLGAATFSSLPDGVKAGYTGNGGAGSMYQDLADTFVESWTYTLSVYIGNRAGLSAYGFNALGEVSLQDSSGTTLVSSGLISATPGTFSLVTLSYTVQYGSLSAGQNIRVHFSSPAGSQASYDQVSVIASPEPATMAALGLGAVALLRRRKK